MSKYEVGQRVYMRSRLRFGQVWTGRIILVKKGWFGYKYLLEWEVNSDFGHYTTHGWRWEGELL